MTIFECLKSTGLPCVFSHFKDTESEPISPPYLAYVGSGQRNLDADNTHYWRENTYQVEYYFITKDESKEADIEDTLLANGYLYEKSEDIYLEVEGVFLIYYSI